MTGHTKGPWVVNKGGSLAVISGDGKVVAYTQRRGQWDARLSETESPHNACLIAAAPCLLEALELADAMLSGANMNANVVERKVRAAIAKARGMEGGE